MKIDNNNELINERELMYIEDHQIDIDKEQRRIQHDDRVDDSVKMYLREIGKYPLLKNADEEMKYAKLVNSQVRKKLLKAIEKDGSRVHKLNISLLFNSLCDNNYEDILNSILLAYSKLNNAISDGDILYKYLKEARKVNRALNKKELKEFFNISTNHKLTEVELYDEVKKYINYCYGFDILFVSNLRLVVSIAGKYARRNNFDLNELINEGNMGLIKAIDGFNPDLGFRFSTYATYKIRQPIIRAIENQGKFIRIPVTLSNELNRFKRLVQEFEQEKGKTLSSREIAMLLVVKENEQNTELTQEEIDRLTIKKTALVDRYMELLMDPLYIDQTISDEDDSTIGDILPSNTNVEEEVLQRVLKEEMEEMFKILSPREIKVLKMRWGVCEYDGIIYSSERIAKILHISPGLVDKIEARARDKIQIYSKRNEKVKALKIYN